MVHLVIWACFNACVIKITLNQPGEERWSLRHTLLSCSSGSNSNGWFFWRWVSLIGVKCGVSGIEGASPSCVAWVEGATSVGA